LKKFLLSTCSVIEIAINLLVISVVVLFLFSLTPALFPRLMQSMMGLGLLYMLLNRAALHRREAAVDLTEWRLHAGLSLCQSLARSAADSGRYCPGCGRRGTVSVAATAYVTQGPKVGDECYAFEGNADHYRCGRCEAQFVDWSSSWPILSGITTLLAVIGHRSSDPVRWTVNVIAVGDAIALLGSKVSEEELIERAEAENCAVLCSKTDPVGPITLFEELSGDLVQFSFRGTSSAEALSDLRAKMHPGSRDRLVGIPGSAWPPVPS
jgi:hypothetical protein